LLNIVDKQPLGASYYRLADVRPPPVKETSAPRGADVSKDKFHPKYPLLGYLLNIKHYKLAVARKRAEAAGAAEADYQAVLWRDLLNSI